VKRLFFLLIFGVALCVPLLASAGTLDHFMSSDRPRFFLDIERFFRGATFRSIDAERLSFTITPTRAFFRVSF